MKQVIAFDHANKIRNNVYQWNISETYSKQFQIWNNDIVEFQPVLSFQPSSYIENQANLENITDIDLANYRELKNL